MKLCCIAVVLHTEQRCCKPSIKRQLCSRQSLHSHSQSVIKYLQAMHNIWGTIKAKWNVWPQTCIRHSAQRQSKSILNEFGLGLKFKIYRAISKNHPPNFYRIHISTHPSNAGKDLNSLHTAEEMFPISSCVNCRQKSLRHNEQRPYSGCHCCW